jgi:CRISPR-associated protein Cmr3
MTEYRFIRPLDVLYLRGNALFGGPGDHGEALMPPWPSLAAGALRARMLASAGQTAFRKANGRFLPLDGSLGVCLGTPDQPGSFRLRLFTVARRSPEGGEVEALFPLPADLSQAKSGGAPSYLRPAPKPEGVASSYPLPLMPVLRQSAPEKPESGRWLTAAGFRRYLTGRIIPAEETVAATDLWRTDSRLGIALDGAKRTAAEGQIYTVDAVAMADGAGFLVGVDGADGLVPEDGLLRLGGDGRGAEISACHPAVPEPPSPEPPWPEIEDTIARTGRFRIILASPGIFAGGWRPDGVGDDHVLRVGATTARLVAAAVPRAQVVSGWDIARWRPKPAERAAPSGSVYWFEGLEGGAGGLRRLAGEGWWAARPAADGAASQRQAEGFNRLFVAASAADDA